MANVIKKNANGYGYKYTDLAEINEYCGANGIEYYQTVEIIEGRDYISTVLTINGKEQPARRGCRVEQATLKGINNPAQEQGSAITYARRYSLLMALGLATTDDDAMIMTTHKATKEQVEDLKAEMKVHGTDEQKLLGFYAVSKVEEMSAEQIEHAISFLKAKKEDKQ